ncbi:hypothetical protein DKX38_019397 [Salix brachista]|uniref:Uncharacterized protein n=1 Tax=Salix brachista TaxID=2182728 RepID=A0A5N5KGC6_9ROSI|nr:hypothetical protein DKX38_019397 [Salix brachista]
MVEETVAEAIEANLERPDSAAVDMDMVEDVEENGAKRAREGEEEDGNEDLSKKQKVDKSVEEERLEKLEEEGKGEGKKEKKEEEERSGPVSLGPKTFGSAVEMLDYFYNILNQWPPNLKVNKYEHMVLVDLLKTGHSEPDKKIGCGIQAFQVRFHPRFKSRCFFLIRDDDSVDDFSFKKCVDHILPLPEDMKGFADPHQCLLDLHLVVFAPRDLQFVRLISFRLEHMVYELVNTAATPSSLLGSNSLSSWLRVKLRDITANRPRHFHLPQLLDLLVDNSERVPAQEIRDMDLQSLFFVGFE